MESTTDFEKLLFLYKTEGRNMTIESFCISNGVNYRAFDKWYRNCHRDIVPIQIISKPETEDHQECKHKNEQFSTHESLNEYLNMDKLTIIKMLQNTSKTSLKNLKKAVV